METLTGYTTGVYAAAAARAATRMLLTGEKKEKEKVVLPSGEVAMITILSVGAGDNLARSSVIKKPSNDADVTNGIRISVTAKLLDIEDRDRILVRGGNGVGIVTLPGLKIEVGKHAINPVPLQMIDSGVRELIKVLKTDRSIELTIAAQNGEKIAKKTFNPKLGIIGGISIIGTTGVVRPMSDESWKESLIPQVDMSIAAGFRGMILTFGNLGEKAACSYGFSKLQIVQMSNFVGFMLDACIKRDVEKVFLIGHLGKMIKIANGRLDTHSRRAKQDLSMIIAFAKEEGFPVSRIIDLSAAKSGEAVISALGSGGGIIIDKVAKNAGDRISDHVARKMKVAVAITDLSGKIVGCEDEARAILKEPSKWGRS